MRLGGTNKRVECGGPAPSPSSGSGCHGVQPPPSALVRTSSARSVAGGGPGQSAPTALNGWAACWGGAV